MICFRVHVNEFTTASEIIVQKLPDFRTRVALDTCKNIYWLGYFSISEGWCFLVRIYKKFPLGVSRVKQIEVDLVTLLCMGSLEDLSAAVITLHHSLFIPGL